MQTPSPTCFELLVHWIRRAASQAACTAGRSRAIKHGDDRNHHQQLDQGKRRVRFACNLIVKPSQTVEDDGLGLRLHYRCRCRARSHSYHGSRWYRRSRRPATSLAGPHDHGDSLDGFETISGTGGSVGAGRRRDPRAPVEGLSRAGGEGAIETGRLVPVGRGGAGAWRPRLECRVEDLFRLRKPAAGAPHLGLGAPAATPCRYWVGRDRRQGPALSRRAESPGDDPARRGAPRGSAAGRASRSTPSRTLLMACCDPAVGLLAAELAREAGVRLLAFQRSSRTALTLLGQGLVHAAGVHLEPAR